MERITDQVLVRADLVLSGIPLMLVETRVEGGWGMAILTESNRFSDAIAENDE